ncbi:hypothetical protein ACFLR2_02120, partial [Chlamydiota bacterium]
MSNSPSKVSKPRSEVFEYFPEHKVLSNSYAPKPKRTIVFLHRGKQEAWKGEAQRDKVFRSIEQAEAGLKSRTIVEIQDITEDSCSYTYRADGKIVRKKIDLAPQEEVSDENRAPDSDPLVVRAPAPQPQAIKSTHKVHELSLRQFKQIEISNAVVEGLKSVLSFLATPFAAFYRLVSGKEARSFTEMLNPVLHDRVGELTHDDVLSQVRFVGNFLSSTDTVQHGKDLGLKAEAEKRSERDKTIYYNGEQCPCREKVDANGKGYYEIYTESKSDEFIRYWLPNDKIIFSRANDNQLTFNGTTYFYRNHIPDVSIEIMMKQGWMPIAKTGDETLYEGKVCTLANRQIPQIEDPNRRQTYPTSWIDATEEEFKSAQNSRQRCRKDYRKQMELDGKWHNTQSIYRGNIRVLQVEIGGNWVDIKEGLDSWNTPHLAQLDILREHESSPKVVSAVQRAGSLFSEGYALGKKIHEARNSGSKKKSEAAVMLLSMRLNSISPDHPIIVPVGQGEGRDYLPHFLVFVKEPAKWAREPGQKPRKISEGRTLMKHICFSSTSLQKERVETVKTYDITGLGSGDQTQEFFRALIAMHPYTRKRDANEVSLKGPANKDLSLENLLLTAGTLIPDENGPVKSRPSRDPVKALFTVIRELNLKETQVSELESKLPEISSSKAHFFKFYVDHLTTYFEENEGKLTTAERGRALDGILHYANKVRHYMEKEVGVDTALAISEHFMAFVEKKLEELKRTERLEKQDLANLQSKVKLFWARLAEPIDETLVIMNTTKNVEGSRVRATECLKVEELRAQLENNRLIQADRQKVLKDFKALIGKARAYLQKGELLAAKTLLVDMMQALPPAQHLDPLQNIFWDSIPSAEINGWNSALTQLAEATFEASARSGTYPLRPHEVFDFHTVIPLIQRRLFERKIPVKVGEFDAAWNAYKQIPAKVAELEASKLAFIAMREQQIVDEVTEQHKKRWKEEDKADAERMGRYRSEYADYLLQLALHNFQHDPQGWNQPHAPVKPDLEDPAVKRARRERELAGAIEIAKRNDLFLGELNALNTADMNWDALMTRSDRLVAVMGCFARIAGISRDLLSYKIGGMKWIRTTFYDHRYEDIWLMSKDRSVLIGNSPAFDKRYQACKRAFNALSNENPHGINKTALLLLIGYEEKGDGTEIKDDEEVEQLLHMIGRHQAGFFNRGKGVEGFVPEELAQCRKVIEMRKILSRPTNHLQTHAAGLGGVIQALFRGEQLSADTILGKLTGMSAIHMVAAKGGLEGCFTLSTSPDTPGSLATTFAPEETPTHAQRQKFLGQLNNEQVAAQVGGDSERAAFMQHCGVDRLFREMDIVENFLLSATGLTKGLQPSELSYLTVSQCIHFIYQHPDKLIIPSVQHRLYTLFFQKGLIRELLAKNPRFFITQGGILKEICAFLQTKPDHLKSDIFLREVSERIRRQAKDLQKTGELSEDDVREISAALPEYDQKRVAHACLGRMETNEQKEYAQFLLAYYCHRCEDGIDPEHPDDFPNPKAMGAWAEVLNAFYIMQKSTREMGHSGWQAELIDKVQTKLLPLLGPEIDKPENADLRNQLLNTLSRKEGNWQKVNGKEYAYYLTVDEKVFEVDLRTGKNFAAKMVLGERCKLPAQITGDDAQYRFLFKTEDPTVESVPGDNGIVDYYWKKDEIGASEFKFRYNNNTLTYQVFQTVRGVTYRFQRLSLSESVTTKLWQLFARHGNSTIEELVKNKGVWIPVDESGKPDKSRIVVAQYGTNLEKDPISLRIQGDKILEASVGHGEEKMRVCSGLSKKDGALISCRDGNGLLLLSRDGVHVDEIRFPVDPGTQEQLSLKRDSKERTRWVVSGREDWEWQLTNTKEYEGRFGKNWRQYILPLKNTKTLEEEFWIFPHLIAGGEKKGSEIKFLRSAVDFIDAVGGKLSQSGIAEGVDFEELRAYAGAAEGFAGGAGNLLQAVGHIQGHFADHPGGADVARAENGQQDQMFALLKSIASPRGIRYRIERRSESSTHAGFFYLAFVASKQGDWATASRYMQLMVASGLSAGADDIKQLQKMTLLVLGTDLVSDGLKALMTPQSPMEAAFRAKFFAALLASHTSLKAQHGIELLGPDLIPGIEARGGDLVKIVKDQGVKYYMQYRGALPQHYREFADRGMLLTPREEAILTDDTEAFKKGTGKNDEAEAEEEGVAPKTAAPFRFALPQEDEIKAMVNTMSDMTNSNGVWSIHQLHKTWGTYPKWQPLLSHFWDYWDWIYNNELAVEDIAFLLRDIPEKAKHREAVDTARRILLMQWHYSKGGEHRASRNKHDASEEALLKKIQDIRLSMTDLAEIQMKRDTLKQEAAMSPSIPRAVSAYVYNFYVKGMQLYSNITYTEKVGGEPHRRGPKHDFKKISEELLLTFLGKAHALAREADDKITINAIRQTREYVAPHQEEPEDPRKIHLERAASQLT